MDGEEDWPCDGNTDQAGDDAEFEVAEKEEAIQGVVIEHKGIWNGVEFFDPASEGVGDGGSAILLGDAADEGTGSVTGDKDVSTGVMELAGRGSVAYMRAKTRRRTKKMAR